MSARMRRSGFLEDTRGLATVEVAVWLPFFFLVLFAIADVSFFCLRYAQMVDTVRETAREVSLGRLRPTDAAVAAVVRHRLGEGFASGVVGTGPDLIVAVEAPIGSVSVFGFAGVVMETVGASARARLEPGV